MLIEKEPQPKVGAFIIYNQIIIPLGNKKSLGFMNKITIHGEQPFSVLAHSFAVGQTTNGYTLMYSAGDGNFTAWEESTPADETMVVNNIAKGMVFYLSGNTDDNVLIKY